jgi:hypothetical protein
VRLLLDQDVYETTARFLIDWRHDVVSVAELERVLSLYDEQELKSAFIVIEAGNIVLEYYKN